MQNSMSNSAISNECIKAIFLENLVKMTMLLPHGNFPKDHIVFFSRSHVPAKIEETFIETWSIPVEKVQSSLFVEFYKPLDM